MKKCSNCKENKPLSRFYKSTQTKDGLTYYCRECVIERNSLYARNNSEKVNERKKRWAQKNSDRIKRAQKKYRENHYSEIVKKDREYRKRNPEKWRAYYRERAKEYKINNPTRIAEIRKKRYENNKPAANISHMIYISLKRNKNNKHWENLVGYKLQDLIAHLEKQFKPGMSWENYGKWQIDHIKPISSFDFNSYNDPEFKECWALSNLQPLWANENLSKGNRI